MISYREVDVAFCVEMRMEAVTPIAMYVGLGGRWRTVKGCRPMCSVGVPCWCLFTSVDSNSLGSCSVLTFSTLSFFLPLDLRLICLSLPAVCSAFSANSADRRTDPVEQLGLGDTSGRGGTLLSMGDNLPFVDLGPGETASRVVAANHFTCVLLKDETVT